jgi:hypothetical protein
MGKFSYCYDPELDLWAVMQDGYMICYHTFKWEAVRDAKNRNRSRK